MKLNTHRTMAQPGSPQAKISPPIAQRPLGAFAQCCNPKCSITAAPPPMLATTVLISPTVHSRDDRGGVISMTTIAARVAPLAAATDAPPAALNAAAPAALLLAGSVMVACKVYVDGFDVIGHRDRLAAGS